MTHGDKPLRDYWLATRAAYWAYLVSVIANSNLWGTERARIRQLELHLYGAHMCGLTLHHLHTCLRFLGSHIENDEELRELAADFRTAYEGERVKELRDALEHEENRVSGQELHGHAPYVGLYPDPNTTTFHAPTGLLRAVSVLDEQYVIEKTIAAAMQLELPLKALADKLSPYMPKPSGE